MNCVQCVLCLTLYSRRKWYNASRREWLGWCKCHLRDFTPTLWCHCSLWSHHYCGVHTNIYHYDPGARFQVSLWNTFQYRIQKYMYVYTRKTLSWWGQTSQWWSLCTAVILNLLALFVSTSNTQPSFMHNAVVLWHQDYTAAPAWQTQTHKGQ